MAFLLLLLLAYQEPANKEIPIHESGLIAKGDWTLVLGLCTGCHSSALVVQNRLDADGWEDLIRWMERTQNLQKIPPDLEKRVIAYLAKYYGPEQSGRRKPLPEHLLPPMPKKKEQ